MDLWRGDLRAEDGQDPLCLLPRSPTNPPSAAAPALRSQDVQGLSPGHFLGCFSWSAALSMEQKNGEQSCFCGK